MANTPQHVAQRLLQWERQGHWTSGNVIQMSRVVVNVKKKHRGQVTLADTFKRLAPKLTPKDFRNIMELWANKDLAEHANLSRALGQFWSPAADLDLALLPLTHLDIVLAFKDHYDTTDLAATVSPTADELVAIVKARRL